MLRRHWEECCSQTPFGLGPILPPLGEYLPGIVLDGLEAWWKHNEGAGGVLTDYGPNGYHGVIYGSGFWDNLAPDGSPVGTYRVANSNYVHDINDDATTLRITDGSPFTVMAAYYTTARAAPNFAARVICRANVSPIHNYVLQTYNGEDEWIWFYQETDGTVHGIRTNDFNIALNTWEFVTVTGTMGVGSSLKVYKNLVEKSYDWDFGTGNEAPGGLDGDVCLGANSHVISNYLDARVGDELVYSKALSLEEITKNFNILKPRYGL